MINYPLLWSRAQKRLPSHIAFPNCHPRLHPASASASARLQANEFGKQFLQ